ncbi:MAG: DUF2059 domain-containing protein [Acidobacteriota bacterium]
MHTLSRATLFLLAIVALGLSIRAQSPAPISEEKRKLIMEIIAEMKMKDQMSKVRDTVLDGLDKVYPATYNAALDAVPGLTPQRRAKMVDREANAHSALTTKIRDGLASAIDYDEFIDQEIVPIYAGLYTEVELTQLLTFYRSPIGQKVVETTPELFRQSQEAAQRFLIPKMLPLIQKIAAEEIERIKREAEQKDSGATREIENMPGPPPPVQKKKAP